MRGPVIALLVLTAFPAMADDFGIHLDNRHERRAFWINPQTMATARAEASAKAAPKFTTTYMDGIAQRFGIGPGGHVNLFEHRLSGEAESGPAIVGMVDHGAAVVALKWHPGE